MRASVPVVALLASAAAALPNLGAGQSASTSLSKRREVTPYVVNHLVRRHGDDEDDEDEGHVMSSAMTSSEHDDHSASSESASAQAIADPATSHSHSSGTEHEHGLAHGPPLLVINETEILLHHAPDPPSYYDFDQGEDGKPGVLVVHVALMTFAFFVLLPLSIFLKAGRSHLSILPQTGFLATSILGLVFGQIYNGLTPPMYERSSHTSWGWITMVLAIALNIVDVARFILRFTRWGDKLDAKFAGLSLSEQLEKDEEEVFKLEDESEEQEALVSSPTETEVSPERRWGPLSHARFSESDVPARGHSTFSDSDTVFDSAGPDGTTRGPSKPKSTRARVRSYASAFLDFMMRMLILLAWVQVCNGIAVWTGTCRDRYLNGCLAHVIKGSIFLWYGLLTFARYCGGMSSLGWAWNRHPTRHDSIWTAEFVESLVIFVYGSTNTWMERMGKTGAYSIKDVQHISIAVMFWAAGALGMLLESRTIRSWLSTPAVQASGQEAERVAPPSSASFSFNPFPALVIGITGVAMSAHHQVYQFQVEVHALWGYLLAGFSVFRFLTYFFLYLRPPASILPSRPPTEALASLCLACGGVVFILSTEQVTFAAMRHNADDNMAFLNITFAAVCTWFFWIACLFGVKGWALKRNAPPTSSSLRASQAKSASLA
ncbi:hypothetical protein JCM1841_004825 [Sporobolomyces salmonicolor]